MKRSTVLVADDHSLVLARVLSLLNPFFEVVGTASDGADLVDKAQRLCPDAIVSDITMPRISGSEAAHKLRELGAKAKLVFLTMNDEPEVVHAFWAKELQGTVAQFVGQSEYCKHVIDALYFSAWSVKAKHEAIRTRYRRIIH